MKKRPKKTFLGNFWKKFTKILPNFYLKNFGVRHQKWIAQNNTKVGPFGSAGGQIPKSASNFDPA